MINFLSKPLSSSQRRNLNTILLKISCLKVYWDVLKSEVLLCCKQKSVCLDLSMRFEKPFFSPLFYPEESESHCLRRFENKLAKIACTQCI